MQHLLSSGLCYGFFMGLAWDVPVLVKIVSLFLFKDSLAYFLLLVKRLELAWHIRLLGSLILLSVLPMLISDLSSAAMYYFCLLIASYFVFNHARAFTFYMVIISLGLGVFWLADAGMITGLNPQPLPGNPAWFNVFIAVATVITTGHFYRYYQSEKQQAAEMIERLHREAGRLIDLAPSLIFIKDQGGRYTFVNQAMADFCNLDKEEMLGKDSTEIQALKVEGQSFKAVDQSIFDRPQSFLLPELVVTQKAGEKHYLRAIKTPVMNGKMETRAVIGMAEDITEQVLAEQSFANVFDQSSDLIYIFDLTGHLIDINPKALDKHGFVKEEVLGEKLGYIIDYERSEIVEKEILKGGLLQGHILRFDCWCRQQMGGGFPVEIVFRKGFFFGRDVLIATGRDLSQRFEAERALKASEAKYRLLFENAFDGILIYNHQLLKPVSANDKAYQIFGVDKEAYPLLNPVQFLPNEQPNGDGSATRFFEMIHQLVDEQRMQAEFAFLNTEGELIYTEISAILLPEPNDHLAVFILREITERKKADLALRQKSREQQTIIDGIPFQFIWKDTNGTALMVNQRAADNLGKTPEELVGRHISRIGPDKALRERQEDDKVISSGQPFLGIIDRYERDGKTFWERIDKVPIKDDHGKVNGVLVFSFDVSDLHRTQVQLADKNRQLQSYISSNMQLENFAYIASHDLKEPLRTVISFSQLLAKNCEEDLDQKGKEYLKFIISETKVLEMLIQDLLEYAKVDNEPRKLEIVDIDHLVTSILGSLKQKLKENDAVIHYDALPTRVVGDYTQLRQLFQNLIVNGLKFARPETRPEIHIRAVDQEGYWQFFVKDNGIGIPAEFQDRIFLLFKKLHTKSNYQGSGIGLALCRKITELHGGKIWVNSQPGKGSTFIFNIAKNLTDTLEEGGIKAKHMPQVIWEELP
ncbi:MAG: PAS domain S-box protein [Bacteroidota bacterium]